MQCGFTRREMRRRGSGAGSGPKHRGPPMAPMLTTRDVRKLDDGWLLNCIPTIAYKGSCTNEGRYTEK